MNWRNGKAGFVGGLKYAIKGVFSYFHSVTTEAVLPSATSGLSVCGTIATGQSQASVLSTQFSVCGELSSISVGVMANINSSSSVFAKLNSDGTTICGSINQNKGVEQ